MLYFNSSLLVKLKFIVAGFCFLFVGSNGSLLSQNLSNNSEYSHFADLYSKYRLANDSAFYCLDQLERIARDSGSTAQYHHILLIRAYEYCSRNNDTVVPYVHSILPVLQADPTCDAYVKAVEFLVSYCINNFKIETAIHEVNELDKYIKMKPNVIARVEVHILMGQLYLASKKNRLAIECFNEGVKFIQTQKTNNPKLILLAMEMQVNTCVALNELSDYSQILTVAAQFDSLKTVLVQWDSTAIDPVAFNSAMLDQFSFKVIAHSKLGNTVQAKHSFMELQSLLKRSGEFQPSEKVLACYASGVYYEANNRDDDALRVVNEGLALSYLAASNTEYLLSLQYHIYRKQKQFEKALDVKEVLTCYRDSVVKVKTTAQLNELKTIHQVDRFQRETEKYKERIGVYLAFVLLLFAIILIVIIYSARVRLKSRGLYNIVMSRQKDDDELQVLREKLEKSGMVDVLHRDYHLLDENDSVSASEKLYRALQEEMIQMRFTDPNLNRDSMAALLHTNRTYLIHIVKEKTGMAFSDYVNAHRLDYARSLVIHFPHKSVKEIIHASGFSSRSTFNRLFIIKFGLTPSELRQFILEDNSEL